MPANRAVPNGVLEIGIRVLAGSVVDGVVLYTLPIDGLLAAADAASPVSPRLPSDLC